MYISKRALALLSLIIGSSVAGAAANDVVNQSSSTTRNKNKTKSSLRGRIRNLLEGATLNNNAVVSTHHQRKLSVGCYETYQEGLSYAIDAYVSYAVSDSNFPEYVLNEDTGLWELDDDPTTTTYNYKCNSIRCGDAMYGPGESGESLAWEKMEECNADLPMQEAPLPELWDEVYCPQAFDDDEEDYEGGELREDDAMVYQCAASPQNAFCSMDGYEPNKNAHISTVWVWEQLGRCEGTFPPSPNPINMYDDLGGCFCEYNKDETYVAGDKVSVKQDGVRVIYQCKSAPNDRWCGSGIISYEPGTGQYWDMAWTLIGTCEGTIKPTLQPTMDPLANVGGCPNEWEEWTNVPGQTKYEEGDLVSLNGLVYKCKSSLCSSTGFQPEEDVAAPGAWKEAWSLVGYCSGTVKPTMSPNFETLDVIDGGCPDGWDEAGEYDEGDFVAVVVSEGFEDTSGRTRRPSSQPVTPTLKPTSQFCFSPTSSPTTSTSSPSKGPSVSPSSSPTSSPTTAPPSKSPTQNPTEVPTGSPSKEPTSSPTVTSSPSQSTSPSQTVGPTTHPTRSPSKEPTSPSKSPSSSPSKASSKVPSSSPSQSPTPNPTPFPTLAPVTPAPITSSPSDSPTTSAPTTPFPTDSPSTSSVPSSSPSQSSAPSDTPSDSPSTVPSFVDDGVRTVVYKCDAGPGYCSQFDPAGNTGLGWKAVGYCRGTRRPTGSPTLYGGTCTYEKCVDGTVSPTTSPSGSPTKEPTKAPSLSPSKSPSKAPSLSPSSSPTGSPSKSPSSSPSSSPTAVFADRRKLQSGTIPRLSRNLEVCTTEDVLNYSTTTEYESGDVVRIGTKRYKCRGLPNGLWCKNPAYAPAESNVWEQAWVEDGNCSQSSPID